MAFGPQMVPDLSLSVPRLGTEKSASPSQKLASLLQQPVRLDLPVRRPNRGSELCEAKLACPSIPSPWQSQSHLSLKSEPHCSAPRMARDEERRSSVAFEKRVTMVPPAPPAPWMGRSSSSPSLREPELRESEPMVPADFPSTLRRVRRGAPSRANIAVGTTRTTSSTAAAGSTGHTGMHRDRGRAAEELLELVDAREDLTAARAYLRASTAGQAVQAAAPPAPPVRKLQRSKQGHFTVLRRTSNVRRPRQAQEIDVSPEAVDPYAASFAEVSEVSEGLLLTDHDRGLETKSMDSGYSWPWQEGIEPLASMLRSLEFQVEALFELMDAHSFKEEADASVVDVINRKREALHNTFAALKEALWWTRSSVDVEADTRESFRRKVGVCRHLHAKQGLREAKPKKRKRMPQPDEPDCAQPGVLLAAPKTEGKSHQPHLSALCGLGPLGANKHGQCNIPEIPSNLEYVQVATGTAHSVLLRSDGHVVACGDNRAGQCDVPSLNDGCQYVQDFPELEGDRKFVQVETGLFHMVLLTNDGQMFVRADNEVHELKIPDLHDNQRYVQVSAGDFHVVWLLSDGTVVAAGDNRYGQCSIPSPGDLEYTKVSAGGLHTAMLCSDGRVLTVGNNRCGQCDEDISAGDLHTVLLRSDGRVVAFGDDHWGQCQVPEPEAGEVYVPSWPGDHSPIVVQLVPSDADHKHWKCFSLAGRAVLSFAVSELCVEEFWTRLTEQFHAPKWKLQVVLSNGELLCDSKLHQLCPAYRALGA
eukprot:s2382_g13.t1